MSFKDRLLDAAVGALLTLNSRPDAIRRALAGRWYPYPPAPTRARVTTAAVQMELRLVGDGVQLADQYYWLTRRAVEQGAQLVVFPEYTWLPLLGLLPPVRELAQSGATLQGAVEQAAPGSGLTIQEVLRTIAPAVGRVLQTTASELAARFRIYLMPGAALAADGAGHLLNCSALYGPDGRLIGTQLKLHPDRKEVGWLTCGGELEVWPLPFATVAAPVCMDFTYWETTRIAVQRGAEILLDMKADDAADEPYLAARGVRTRVQEVPAYGVGAYCVSDLFRLGFSGPSFIAAPLGLFDAETSLLAETQTSDREEVIVAELDLERLREFRRAHAPEFNRALYRKYLPSAYADYRTRVRRDGKRLVQ